MSLQDGSPFHEHIQSLLFRKTEQPSKQQCLNPYPEPNTLSQFLMLVPASIALNSCKVQSYLGLSDHLETEPNVHCRILVSA